MNNYLKYGVSNYDKYPSIKISNVKNTIWNSYESITQELKRALAAIGEKQRIVLALDFYYGVDKQEIEDNLIKKLPANLVLDTSQLKLSEAATQAMLQRDLTEDRIFGFQGNYALMDFFDLKKVNQAQTAINEAKGLVIIYNVGASAIVKPDIIIYFDMARWEIELRQRAGQDNWDAKNYQEDVKRKYKRSYFIEWRVFDNHKRAIFEDIDYWFDNNRPLEPKLVKGEFYREQLRQLVHRPFRVVPYFDPGVWGGQWMKQVCDLPENGSNYAWCFDCVPEENSLYLDINGIRFETPSINLVHYQPEQLLGEKVYCRFGAEFPIRSDLLDNMEGQNLSLHVHPLFEYMRQHFGLSYTQDESYYILDGLTDQSVYLGFKNGVQRDALRTALLNANNNPNQPFMAEEFVNHIPAKPHDHFMIPAGTPHCSGKNTMVLEISATPYIFTLRMWDWGRVDFDGKPRPIYIDGALENLQLQFDSDYTQKYLVSHPQILAQGTDYLIEKTGLHEREFIETWRYTFTNQVTVTSNQVFHILNLVAGRSVILHSPTGAFADFELHYAEVVIIPAQVDDYVIINNGGDAEPIKVLRSFVRC